ncbi:MAG: winged helix-turn-helix domain-containing tetratricopeptide repeat protein [Bryobacteraceae bacterium]
MGGPVSKALFRFGEYELDAACFEISRKGRPVRIERLPMQLLLFLIEHREGLVTREEIAERLWGRGVHLDADNGINTAIGKLRRLFRDDAARPRFIKTVTGAGYRFIAPVEVIEPAIAESKERSRVMVAVLPFENLTAIPGQDYFAEGITEDTISHLGQIEPLRLGVIARTSTMAYRGSAKTIAQIGGELSVDFVLESSVRRQQSSVRITSHLIRVNDQAQVWSGSFDRDMEQFLGIQDELGRAIAQAVQVRLAPPTAEGWRSHTKLAEAYDLYLRGTYFWNQLNPPGIEGAIECYREAVTLDPNYALAWSGMAECYAFLPVSCDAPALDVWPKAMSAARRAVELAPGMSEGHASLGVVQLWMEWDWAGAESSLRRAIELNASNVNAWRWRAILLSDLGRFAESAREITRARELDPMSPLTHGLSGALANHARRDGLATEHLRRAMALNPSLWVLHLWKGRVLEQQGRFEDALKELREAFDASRGSSEALALQAFVHARAGNPGAAREVLRLLDNMRQTKYVPPSNLALVHAALGENSRALDWLDDAYASRDVRLTWLAVEPRWDLIRGEPRFQDLLARLGLPQALVRETGPTVGKGALHEETIIRYVDRD